MPLRYGKVMWLHNYRKITLNIWRAKPRENSEKYRIVGWITKQMKSRNSPTAITSKDFSAP